MASERSAMIQIGEKKYEMLLTTRATKEIAKRYGGLSNLGEKLMKSENFEMALDEIVWLITLLANQSVMIHNLQNLLKKGNYLQKKQLNCLLHLLNWVNTKMPLWKPWLKVQSAMWKVRKHPQKLTGRVSDEESFARLIFYGVSLLQRSEQEVWLMPIGHLLDQWEVYKQYHGLSRPKREYGIDEIIPYGI